MSVEDTLNRRQKTHGDFEHNASVSQTLKKTIDRSPAAIKGDLHPVMLEALDAIFAKVARIVCGDPAEPDHWHDIAGYATLVEEILLKRQALAELTAVPPAPSRLDEDGKPCK